MHHMINVNKIITENYLVFTRPNLVLYFQSWLSQDTKKDDFLEKDGCGRAGCSANF